MTFAGLLCHTVEVYRRSGDVDRFGQAEDVNPALTGATPDESYPCRVTRAKSGGLAMMERTVDVFEPRYTMFTEMDADIREDDAVRVLDADGAVLIPKAKVYVKTTASGFAGGHHLEFDVHVQRGPL